jgi:hypothetical protein
VERERRKFIKEKEKYLIPIQKKNPYNKNRMRKREKENKKENKERKTW